VPVSERDDEVLLQLLGLIGEHGWAVRHVGAGAAACFSYTVGLTALGHPEFVMTGMPFESAQGFLNMFGAEVRDGKRFTGGTITRDFPDPPAPIAIITVSDISGLTGIEQIFGEVSALQAYGPTPRDRFHGIWGTEIRTARSRSSAPCPTCSPEDPAVDTGGCERSG
jgi:hypothetical protein